MLKPSRLRALPGRQLLLAAGALCGLMLAAWNLVDTRTAPRPLPADTIALVGGQPIPLQRYLGLLQDLAADQREPLTAQDETFALQRLVDEELLVLRALELGLGLSAPEVRKALASAMIAQIAGEAEASLPGQQALLHLYRSDAAFFTTQPRYRLRVLWLPGNGEEQLQTMAYIRQQLISGVALQDLIATSGVRQHASLPDSLLPPAKLADYLGAGLATAAAGLSAGEFSQPISSGGNVYLLYLVEYTAGELPEFEQVRELLEQEFVRREGDKALREYLDWLRQRTEIVVDVPERL